MITRSALRANAASNSSALAETPVATLSTVGRPCDLQSVWAIVVEGIGLEQTIEFAEHLAEFRHRVGTLANGRGCGILRPVFGAWRSLVARTVRVGEVPGSNPGAPIARAPGQGVVRALAARTLSGNADAPGLRRAAVTLDEQVVVASAERFRAEHPPDLHTER